MRACGAIPEAVEPKYFFCVCLSHYHHRIAARFVACVAHECPCVAQASFREAVSRSYGAVMPFRTGRLVDQSEVIAQVNDLYNPELGGRFNGDVEAAFVESDGDASVVCPMKELAKMMHAAGTVTWHYAFEYGPTELDMSVQVGLRSPISAMHSSAHWASHSSELPYVFHNPCAICVDLTCRMDQVCAPPSPTRPRIHRDRPPPGSPSTGIALHRNRPPRMVQPSELMRWEVIDSAINTSINSCWFCDACQRHPPSHPPCWLSPSSHQVCLQESRSRWTEPPGALSRRMVKAWGTIMSPTGPWVNDFEPNAQTTAENNRTYWHSLSAYTNGSVPTWVFDAQDRLMVGYRHDACDMWLQDVEQAQSLAGSTLGSG